MIKCIKIDQIAQTRFRNVRAQKKTVRSLLFNYRDSEPGDVP